MHLLPVTYAMMRLAEKSDCRLLTWLYGAKIPCTIEKICKSTRKRCLNNSSCYENVKNEKKKRVCRHGLFYLLFFIFSQIFSRFAFFFLLLGFLLLRYLSTLFGNTRFRPVIEFSYAIQDKLLVRQ